MSRSGHIERVQPTAGISGGEVAVEYGELSSDLAKRMSIRFDQESAHLIANSQNRALVLIPELDHGGETQIAVAISGEAKSIDGSARFVLGRKLAGELHPVANPAFDPSDGALFVTRSGSRGEHVPISIFKIDADDSLVEVSGDIPNPTAIAFDRRGQMFVTSRLDGTVCRLNPLDEAVVFAGGLGIATGLAFNRENEMFVGDRSGTIFRVNEIGEARAWAKHQPSVSAYHLAFGPDGSLYVSGPTVSSFEVITRFDESGEGRAFYRGLGRPQGLAFDRDGNLYVAASLRGRRGIIRISPDAKDAELVVAGMNLVGLAFSATGHMMVTSNDAVYDLDLGIKGTLLTE
jgi:sugar lactone lactonase YvrE